MIAGEAEASRLQYYCCCPLMVMEFRLLSQSALHCVTKERTNIAEYALLLAYGCDLHAKSYININTNEHIIIIMKNIKQRTSGLVVE